MKTKYICIYHWMRGRAWDTSENPAKSVCVFGSKGACPCTEPHGDAVMMIRNCTASNGHVDTPEALSRMGSYGLCCVCAPIAKLEAGEFDSELHRIDIS